MLDNTPNLLEDNTNKEKLSPEIIHLDEKGQTIKSFKEYSNVQPIWRLLVMLIISSGLYIIYWFYRNWKYLRDYEGEEIRPVFRTICLFIPLVSIVLLYFQFKRIKFYADIYKAKTYSSPLLVTIICSLFPPIGPIIVQLTINRYWRVKQKYFPIKKGFSTKEIVVIFFCFIIWMGYLYNIYSPKARFETFLKDYYTCDVNDTQCLKELESRARKLSDRQKKIIQDKNKSEEKRSEALQKFGIILGRAYNEDEKDEIIIFYYSLVDDVENPSRVREIGVRYLEDLTGKVYEFEEGFEPSEEAKFFQEHVDSFDWDEEY